MRRSIAAAMLTTFVGAAFVPAGTIAAAEGDLWAVDRSNVNVRSGPSTNTEVLIRVNPGDKIVEIAAKGEWYYADFPDFKKRGWVFGPLLVKPGTGQKAAAKAPADVPTPTVAAPKPTAAKPADAASTSDAPAGAKKPVAAAPEVQAEPKPKAVAEKAAVSTDGEPAAVKSFRETVAELNDRAVSVAGIDLFSDVRSTGGGGVQVLATETWTSVPEAGQSSYMNALFDRWQSMAGGLGPLSLQIVNPNGKVMMERSGS